MVVFPFLAGSAISLSAASYSEQALVGSWVWRIGLTLAVLLLILLVLASLRRGWGSRKESQSKSGLGVLPTRADEPLHGSDSKHETFSAKYIGTAKADDLFTRVNAGGGPARALLVVADSGIEVQRSGERPLHMIGDSIVAVGSGKGILQKAYARHGLLLITWRWSDQEVTSGFWLNDRDEHLQALTAIERVGGRVPQGTNGPGTTQGGQE